MEQSFPPRIHVLLARSSDLGLVLRRGPSKSVCTLLWNRRRDTFELGQWLRGRIYERRCDLSPDGSHFIYFAMNGRWISETGGSWTAISRAPYLRALVLLGKGDCWHGGGLFTGPRSYWLNEGYGHKSLRASSEVTRDRSFVPTQNFGGECPGVYYPRLLRDGWTLVERTGDARDACTVFEKPLRAGWVLRKLAHEQVDAAPGRGCYWDEHELEHAASGLLDAYPDWEWAERDAGSLVFAKAGALHRVRLPDGDGIGEPSLLRDFSDLRFKPIKAPYG
ncbi:hypothetical protein ENSA5_51430 [Enhygromyxa salina]|uniref:Uncharacterized protein n=1 Tax=Enhygromyxa salina TaxID=215803 RepID=A0A2S9XGW4_9BACT|nr:hypothetical protein [Enhygromyxa salina]PRP92103.1 hypothetical protein ENSA5_51430 [Enhygromyxa salina]